MLGYMHETIKRKETLNNDERNMLSIAYKNKVGPERTSWRILDGVSKRDIQRQGISDAEKARQSELLESVKLEVEKKLIAYCTEIINFINDKLLKYEKNVKAIIFYLKMQGDYYRYLAEF